MNTEVEQYLEELYRRSVSPLDAMPTRPTGIVYPDGVVIEDEGDVAVRPFSESGFAVRGSVAPLVAATPEPAPEMAAPPPVRDEGLSTSYLDALAAAQERDRMTAAAAGALGGVEQAAQIASRGLYRPMGMPRMPSATTELEQRQKAVEDYLERQRGLRAETRAERASEAQMELARGQVAREQARTKAEELRLAIEANEAPERVQKLRAETLAAFERANLYGKQAEAAAKGRQAKLVAGGAAKPKPEKEEKAPALRQLPATVIEDIAGIDVAVNELRDLTEAYKQADLGGVFGRVGSQFGALAPESAKLYEARAAPVRQAVGVILEKGKLAEGDISRYLQMMPRPGDSAAVADAKFKALEKVMLAIKQAKTKAFRETGFQVGEQAPAAAAAPQRSPLASAAEAAVQAVEAARAAGKPKSEIDQLTKKAEAAIEAASKGD